MIWILTVPAGSKIRPNNVPSPSKKSGKIFVHKNLQKILRGADRNRTGDLRVTTAPNSHHLFISSLV